MSTEKGGTRIKDIAEIMGCSLATVSNAINGRGRMSKKMRQEILDKCAELNFVPNSAGRSLRLQRSDAIGLIYAPSFAELFGNIFYARIMEGMAETFGEAGLDLILGSRTDDDGMPSVVRQGKVDALVVLAGVFDAEGAEQLRNCPVPLCVVDGHLGLSETDTMTSDGFGGGRQVAEHFAEYGHRRQAMVTYDTPLYNIEQRTAGFLSGLRGCGIDVRGEELVFRVRDNAEAIERVCAELESDNPPTALFAVNDTLADDLVTGLTERGIRVPEDLSVVGFDNDPIAGRCRPPLTTVGMDKRAFGSLSAKMVLDRLADPDKPPSHQVQPTRLVVRDSVARITS